MKLTTDQTTLINLLTNVTGVIEKRNTIPVLANVVLSVSDSKLSIRGTDMNSDAVTHASVDAQKDGECTVRAELFQGIASKLKKGSLVTLEYSEERLSVFSGKSTFKLATLPVADFPPSASDEYDAEFNCSTDDLARLFDLSAFAMSTEETRYYLNGIYLHPIDGKVRAVTTDGHRLAQVDSDIESQFEGVIVPRKAVTEVRKMLDNDGGVTVKISKGKVLFLIGESVFVTKTIDGTFPDYTRVIPKDNDIIATVDASDMKDAAARVSLVSNERSKAVKVSFSGDQVGLEVKGSDGDFATDELACEYEGDDLSVGVNSKYLAEVLQQCAGDTVLFKLKDEGSPMIIRPSGDDGVLFVVMPMRVT